MINCPVCGHHPHLAGECVRDGCRCQQQTKCSACPHHVHVPGMCMKPSVTVPEHPCSCRITVTPFAPRVNVDSLLALRDQVEVAAQKVTAAFEQFTKTIETYAPHVRALTKELERLNDSAKEARG